MFKALSVALLMVACGPRGFVESRPCASEAPVVDQVIVDAIVCTAERFNGEEEGRPSDYFMGNNWLRAVVRHPESSPTLSGLGGATLVDLATWDGVDILHEAAPLVNGSWLEVTRFELDDHGITVGGLTRPLPDRPDTDEGTSADIRWSIKENDPRIYLEGADALWLHPKGPATIYKSSLQLGDVVLAHDGSKIEDLGGAFRLEGVSWLLLSDVSTAWGWLETDTQRVSGTAAQATHLLLFEEEEAVAKLPLSEEDFNFSIPNGVTSLRAIAEGFAPSVALAPREGLSINLGEGGAIRLRPTWDDSRPSPLQVQWMDSAGQEHEAWMSPEGATLKTGEGVFQLDIKGPDWIAPLMLTIEVEAGETVQADFAITHSYTPPLGQLLVFDTLSDRSRNHRGHDQQQLERVSTSGAAFTLLLAQDDVPETDSPPVLKPYLAHEEASIATNSAGWEILSWPWEASFRRSAHGAIDTRYLDPETALAAAWGGPSTNRFTAVNPAWLQQVEAPAHALEPRPDFVYLDAPDDALLSNPGWSHWFDWLNQGVYLLPLAEQAWVRSANSPSTSVAELQDALIRGRFIATNGPVIEIELSGAKPGDLLNPAEIPAFEDLWVRVAGKPATLDHLVIIGDGEELARWTIDELPFEWSGLLKHRPDWLVAVAWAENTESWAVTAPIWLDSPN